jgi:coenzyme F420-reducing hydrogenase delta subunit
MVSELFLLRAFEAGSDLVLVLTCPENKCKHLDGNIRAKKRVEKTKKILRDIGINENRLTLKEIAGGEFDTLDQIIRNSISEIMKAL